MTRRFHRRLRIEGSLEAQMPLHVGGKDDNPESDLPLARNGRDEFYLPGTSLAGPMRAWMEERYGPESDLMQQLWGWQPARGQSEQEAGAASRLLVEDAPVTLAEGASAEILDGIAIDRQWGGAAAGFKYDRQIMPRGSRVPLKILVELPSDTSDKKAIQEAAIKQALARLCYALTEGEIRFGAGVTRGMGKVTLVCARVTEEDWSSRTGILDVLKAATSTANGPEESQGMDLEGWMRPLLEQTQATACQDRVSLVLRWRAVAPVMSKSGQDGMAVDMLPLVSSVENGKVALMIPGSSLKGALRAHAERIVRTVLDWPEVTDTGRDRHFKQLDVPLVRELFGSARDRNGGTGRRGALAVEPVHAQPVSVDGWRQVLDAQNSLALMTALENAGLRGTGANPQIDQAYHVAVDRWTGGAADSMLYSTLEPHGLTWDQIRITLEPRRLEACHRDAAIFLLLLLLRDLAAGRLPIGFGVNRGYGEIAIEKAELELGNGVSCTLGGEALGMMHARLPEDRLKTLTQSWQVWIRNCREERQRQGAANA